MKRRTSRRHRDWWGCVFATASPAARAGDSRREAVQIDLDNVFVLLSAVLVIFMQAGFALVEAGLTRAKSVANIMMKNLMDFCAGAIAFFAVGYAFAFGHGQRLHRRQGLVPRRRRLRRTATSTVPVFFMFQVAFAATAATIVSGAMAERTKFKAYFVYSIVISAVIYPVVVHWQWGGGWLAQLDTPFHDFAGSTIVHMTGGVAALHGCARSSGPVSGSTGPTASRARSPATTSRSPSSARSSCWSAGTGSTRAPSSPPTRAIGGIAVDHDPRRRCGAMTAMIVIVGQDHGKPDVGDDRQRVARRPGRHHRRLRAR